MIAFILGRQPELSLAELTAVFGQTPRQINPSYAVLDISAEAALAQAPHLGSIIKVLQIIDTIDQTDAALIDLAVKCFANTNGKITLGLSDYSAKASRKQTTRLVRTIGAALAATHSVRLVPTTTNIVSTATVIHNKLAHGNPKKCELSIVAIRQKWIVARTIYVQDLASYTLRDRSRPCRDARNGMLPPKLAQIIINLAQGNTNPALRTPDSYLLDPFCGTGVILQEAALMGRAVYGTDLNPTMIDYTRQNLTWLERRFQLQVSPVLATADATTHNWQNSLTSNQITTVATETYLGRPYTSLPTMTELKQNCQNCNIILGKFIANLAAQLPTGAGVCLAVPAWFTHQKIHHLDCIQTSQLAKLHLHGLNSTPLIYHREGQIVGRELVVLQKS